MKNGFVKVAAASPVLRVADADWNAERIIEVYGDNQQYADKAKKFVAAL